MSWHQTINDALNTLYLWLHAVRHRVNDHSAKKETWCHHYMGYSFQLAVRVLLYAPSHRQNNTHHGLCYTSRNSSMGPPWGTNPMTHQTMNGHSTTHSKNNCPVKEGNVLFNDTLNTFYLRLYGIRHMVKDHTDSERKETSCHHMGYSFQLAARVLLYASSHRQDNTYHGLMCCWSEINPHQWATSWFFSL